MNEFLAIGHRGAKGYVMENTIASILFALNQGVNAIEIDVYRCASGEMVVFHDETLERVSTRVNRIEDLSLAEIQLICLHGGYSIPLLQEVIHCLENKIVINIELKGSNTAEGVFKCVEECCADGILKKENVIISSFQKTELKKYRSKDSRIKIGVLTKENPLKSIPFAQKINAYSIHPFVNTLMPEMIKELHQLKFKVIPFTINDPQEITQFIDSGVDGVFCDYPDRLLAVLNK